MNEDRLECAGPSNIVAGIFAEALTFLRDNLLKWGDLGKLTPMVIGINHWILIAMVWAVGIGFLIGLEKRNL